MNSNSQTIIFAGGCFWCMEAVFQMLRGVESVTSGYAGGSKDKPTYHEVSSESTGHAEVIEIKFDPSVVTLDDLLSVFFTTHDPTTLNRQGGDVGTQYRSAIYSTSDEQKIAIEKFIQKLIDEKTFTKPIMTEIKPLDIFYPAEAYHQNYYRDNADQPYCQVVIDPKIAKLRQKYAYLLK